MGANTFGHCFQIMSFGESHGAGLGVIIDGCPSGVHFDHNLLINELARRRPGAKENKTSIVSDRAETDHPEVLSGVFSDITLGTPIAILVRNNDARSSDYNKIQQQPRPGHADDTWKVKFGHTDHRGGGRSSGRETLARVMGGAVAQMILAKTHPPLQILGWTTQIGPLSLNSEEVDGLASTLSHSSQIDPYSTRCPVPAKNKEMEDLLLEAKASGKSYGGEVLLMIKNPPAGLGQPVFHKLKADLCSAFMGVGATSGVELGIGREAVSAEGSEFHRRTTSTHYGGIRGGISTGESIIFKIFFKPTASVLDTAKLGRHDPCIVPRAIPVLESMAWMVITDHILWQRGDRV